MYWDANGNLHEISNQINNRFIESIIYPSSENVYNFNKNGK